MRFCPILILICLLPLVQSTAHASPCAQLKDRPHVWVTSKIDALVFAARAAYERTEEVQDYERLLNEIVDTMRVCKLSQDEGFVSRFREFVQYVETASLDQQPGHELGFTVPDSQYFAETRQYVQVPDFLTTQSFLRAVSRYETLDRAKSLLRLLNSSRALSDQLLFFSYESRHLGTPDSKKSFWRLLIVVPGDSEKGVPEKWVQFGVPNPGATARVRNVSVVSATIGPEGTSNTYFKDYYRTYRRNGLIGINGRWELGYGEDNCVQCHKSGILPIFPVDRSVTPSEQQAVLAVNRRFLTYGSPHFGKYLNESKLGPGLGAASLVDRNQRFGKAFGETGLARAMTCSVCHQPERLGSLNWPMDRIVISSYIKGGQMPLGYTLQNSERGELYEKLIQEYFATDDAHPGILKSWLLGQR